MDAASGRVLYAKAPNQPRSIASVTKLMTALVAAERCGTLDEVVTVDPRAVGVEGSSLYLSAGEQLPLRELLYGLLLHSGNDAAVAIAIHISGSVDAFVAEMNATARRLGMTQTHFENPNGLEGEAHYSTAYDLALLGQAVLAHPDLSRMAATRTITVGRRTLVNHNKLLWRYEGCVGLKTGFTQKAGRTLVSAARRDGGTLIAVTLNAPDDWNDHTAMLDFGFSQYPSHLLARPGKTLATVAVRGSLSPAVAVLTGAEVRYPLQQDEAVTARIDLPAALDAPIRQGQAVGGITYFLHGSEIGHTDLLAAQTVPADRPSACQSRWGLFCPLTMGALSPQGPRWRGAVCSPQCI